MKKKIGLIGGGFQHSVSTTTYENKFVEWVNNSYNCDITIHVDNGLSIPTREGTETYGWLCESKTIIGNTYDWVSNNIEYLEKNFIKVFTHDLQLSKKSKIFQLTQCSAKSFIEHGEICKKTKLVSMIASNKRMCNEHIYRQQIIQKYSNKCDHFGRGFNEISEKKQGLCDYCFSIVVENATYPNMFTEKITDCFMTGTIPIYYGIENIGDFFDIDGIIKLTDNFKIEDLNFDLYYSKMESIIKNFNYSSNLLSAEDYIYKNFIENARK
jgi:hypothetical protein